MTGAQETTTLPVFGREALCKIDAELFCHHLSDNWHSISGFAAKEETGEGWRGRIAPDHVQKVARYLTETLEYAHPVRFQIKHADGAWRWCEMEHMSSAQVAGKTRHTCLLRDVTEMVALQAKLEKATLEADIAIKSRSEFLANMSHELRTPLNAILGFAQMMEQGTFGDIGHPKYNAYIGDIQESGSTLLSKINDLLEIANIDSGEMVLNETSTDLVAVIRHAIEFHSHRAFASQVTLQDRLPAQPLPVVIDRIRMLQVLTNVLSNAIKYNRPGGRVEICCQSRKDGGINIVIEDTGGGIPAIQLQNILAAFRQDNSFFARTRNCIGLGLALSKEIVKLHQGRIAIDSEPEHGTVLTIRLPKERTIRTQGARMFETLGSAAAV